ncbi:LysR family transcriptional regulator [Paenibacillus sp. SYP-B4298]|uniref:LysR family transcriptional regulator n=1 Tax=Paenibacillus sp. SYP-B4298 TaxID=2996034 RepID=UPI0022DD401F|nr:LysR family transcriptional regulator [Paenibacillus sp. SYP-B4298]
MDLRELNAFQAIVQEGTFSRAAEKLNYAQSTITNQIQRLEKELGVQLFKRGWEAELTSAGRIFSAEVGKLIRHWNEVAELAKGLQQDEIGRLRIGAIEPLMQTILPSAMRSFQQSKPKMTYQIDMGHTESLAHAILRDELDFALCGEPSDPSNFHFQPLYQEKIVFIADDLHPLCGASDVPFREILPFTLIAGGRQCLYHLQLAKHLSRDEISPQLHTITQISSIPYFIQQTSMIGVVLDSTPLPPGIRIIDVIWGASLIPVGFLQLRGREYSPASSKRLLMQIVKEEIERFP